MNSKEIQELLSQRRDIVHTFYTKCEKDPTISTEIDLKMLKESISRVDSLIEEITQDIIAGSVPETFYVHLQHDMEHLIPEDLPMSIWPKKHKIQSYKKIAQGLIEIKDLCETYTFYKKLDFVQKNTVLVGANGCGKTSLANLLKKELNKQDGIVIPAQKLLILPTFSNIPNLASARPVFEEYQSEIYTDKVTFEAKELKDFEFGIASHYGSEMVKVLGFLLGQRQVKNNCGATKVKQGKTVTSEDFKSTLDEVIDIWNNLIEHRQLDCDDNNSLTIKYHGDTYEAHTMSDGERVIIYHVGRVLLAPKNSLIIVDEPEVHLHKTIANKLWDKLEERRKDCVFIYFTHDLDFASSRIAQKGWIKEFQYPNSWKLELIKENVIPEELQLKLLGSRKKILFCEGDTENSIDRQVFEILFPEYTIQPVNSCKTVIAYTRAFNALSNVSVKAYGLIDRDFRSEGDLAKLESEEIYSYSVAEIENLFLVEDFIIKFAKYKREDINIDTIKDSVMQCTKDGLESQIAAYITNRINYTFAESHVKRADTKENVATNFKDFVNNVNIDELYERQKQRLEKIIADGDYGALIRVVNHKGLVSCVSKAFKYNKSRDYIDRALSYLKEEEEGRLILKNYFPDILK